ncbi:MAG TPA: hypothetical protein VFB92_06855 [Vicinamibacterales bacterium]|nr:hypothetical protein [Vicinamibacterales bacterium]
MAASILLVLPALALTVSLADARPYIFTPHRQDIADQQAVADFTTAVRQYAELRRLLESPMSRLTLWAEPEQAARARRAHRGAILEAHGTVQRGHVFTPLVAAYFRREIEFAGRSAGTPAAVRWPAVLMALPELPTELEYRVAGRDLILLDPEIHFVFDILEAAFPPEWAEPGYGVDESETCAPEQPPVVEGTPCDAHSELEICWS